MRHFVAAFPPELVIEIHALAVEHDRLYAEGKYSSLAGIYEAQYNIIRKFEEELPDGFRYHKGAPLFNWGQFLISQNIPEKVGVGLEKIILAFIEDLFDYNTLSQTLNAPASKTLNRFPIATNLIEKIIGIVSRKIESEDIPKDPNSILTEAIEEPAEEIEEIGQKLKEAQEVTKKCVVERGPKEKLVFIGGAYRNIAILNHISHIVDSLGFIPIIASDFDELEQYQDYINETSMILLENCSYAIFEITISNGHLMEIERAKDFDELEVLLVYQTLRPDNPPPITRMVMTTHFKKQSYTNFVQLGQIIGDFLQKKL